MNLAKLVAVLAAMSILGCKQRQDKTELPTEPVASAAAAAAAPSAARFSEDVERKPCELLSAVMVSKVSGVPEAQLKSSTPGKFCRYEGGGVTATLMFVKVGKDAKAQADRFARAYKNKTAEDVAEDMAKVGEQVDKRKEQGAIDEKTAAKARGLGGAMAKGPLGSGLQYDEVEGPWDKAMFDQSEHVVKIGGREIKNYANKIHVLVSNMDFSVEYMTKAAGSNNKDQAVALAKAISEALPK